MPRLLRVLGVATLCAYPSMCTVAAGVAAGPAGRLYTVAPNFVRTDLSGRPLRSHQITAA
jgi:hypothetical protein